MLKIAFGIISLLLLAGCAQLHIMRECKPVMDEPDVFVCKRI